MTPNEPILLNCPTCGAPLDYDGTSSVVRCKFCGNRSLVQAGTTHQDSDNETSYQEIRDLISSGKLKEALEKVRNLNGVEVGDANDALEAIQEGRFATTFKSSSHTSAELTQKMQQIQNLISSGNKLDAIKLYRETFDTSMDRALKAINLLENGQGLQIENRFESVETQSPTPPYLPSNNKKKGCRVFPVIAILIIIGIIGGIFASKKGLFLVHYYSQEPEILIPAVQNASPQIAGLFYDSGADVRFVGMVNPETRRMVWQAAPLKGDGIVRELVNGSDLIYAANEDNLLAYFKSNGSLAWQTVMPDSLNYSGHDLLVSSGRVITRNADQSIQAYNAETGSLVWSKRLLGYSDTMLIVDNSLLVVDFADNDNNYGLFFLDPVTGTQQNLVTPTCTINNYENTLEEDTALFYDASTNTLLLIYREGCVQSLNLSTKQLNWSAPNADYFSPPSDGYKYLFTDSKFFFGEQGNLFEVNKSDGNMVLLSQNPDYNVYPMEIIDTNLILRTDRTRGTDRTELWGVDLSSGVQTWQITMQDASPIEPPNKMSGFIDDTDFGWTIKQTSSGLVRITFQGEPNQLVLDTINSVDGSILKSLTLSIKGVTSDFYDIPVVLGWQNDIAYLRIDSSFYSLDVSSGKLVYIY